VGEYQRWWWESDLILYNDVLLLGGLRQNQARVPVSPPLVDGPTLEVEVRRRLRSLPLAPH
jgi:hypothetical protein